MEAEKAKTMAYHEKPQFENLVEDATQRILKKDSEVKKVVQRTARQIVRDRSSKRFFEDVYARNYSPRELKRRPFLNIGPGSFRHMHWRLADKNYGEEGKSWTQMRRGVTQSKVDHDWDLYERDPIDIASNMLLAVYSSHVIEHLFPEDLDFMLSEVHRILQPGGTLRLVCPDAGLLVRSYENEDWEYFLFYLSVMTSRAKKPLSAHSDSELRQICSVFLLDWVSLVVHPEMPDRFSPGKCVEFLSSFDSLYNALDAAAAMSPRDLNRKVGAHVSWYTADKLIKILKKAGFVNVGASGYLQSRLPIMRDRAYFDRTDCEMSLYVEAEKPA